MKSLNSMIANHLLYLTKLSNSRYPEGYFEGNQLLYGSMSLSRLYSTLTSDLHVSTVRRPSIKVSFDFSQFSIDHHLSGPNIFASTLSHSIRLLNSNRYWEGLYCRYNSLSFRVTFLKKLPLADMSDSLVRVPRRDVFTHHDL
jgi:hypothetical protein